MIEVRTQPDDQPKRLSVLMCNQDWFAEELSARGHTVVTVGPPRRHFQIEYDNLAVDLKFVLDHLPRGFHPDCLVYYDDSGPAWIGDIESAPFPTMFYSVDGHHHVEWHRYFGGAFDRVLVALKDLVPQYVKYNPNSFWFPLWSTVEPQHSTERPIDVCFRGTFNPNLNKRRVDFFDELRKRVNVDAQSGDFREVYHRSKIIINQAVKDDLNFRVFEAISSGALLITPHVGNGQSELFVPGEDIVTYTPDSVDEAAEKIQYYLAHEEERLAIAKRGFDKLIRSHTAAARALQFEEHLYALTKTPRPIKHLGMGVANLFASEISRRQTNGWGNFFLKRAAEYLMKSLMHQEPLRREWEEAVTVCKCYFDEHRLFEDEAIFFKSLREQDPDNLIIAALYMDALLKLQESREQAQTPAES